MIDSPTFPCGHPRSPENTSKPPSANPGGRCRQCQVDRERERRRERRRTTNTQAKCHRGHPLVEENLYSDSRGYRRCRQCRLLTLERFDLDPGGRIDNVQKFREWLEGWLVANDVTAEGLSRIAGVHPRVVRAIRKGERKWLHCSTVDALLCGTGNPHLLGCFHALEGETLQPVPKHRPRRTTVAKKVVPTTCRSGDDCARPAGHGPNGHFCAEIHGPELDRIFAVLNPTTRAQRDQRRRSFVKGKDRVKV